jgi:hypothetical protein
MNELTNASPIIRGARRNRLLQSARVPAPTKAAGGVDRLIVALLFGLVGSALTAPLGARAMRSQLAADGPAPWAEASDDSDVVVVLASAR